MLDFVMYYHFLVFILISGQICRPQNGNPGILFNDTFKFPALLGPNFNPREINKILFGPL